MTKIQRVERNNEYIKNMRYDLFLYDINFCNTTTHSNFNAPLYITIALLCIIASFCYDESLLRFRNHHCSTSLWCYFKSKVMNPPAEVNNRLSRSQQSRRLPAQDAKITRPKVSPGRSRLSEIWFDYNYKFTANNLLSLPPPSLLPLLLPSFALPRSFNSCCTNNVSLV